MVGPKLTPIVVVPVRSAVRPRRQLPLISVPKSSRPVSAQVQCASLAPRRPGDARRDTQWGTQRVTR